MLHARLVTIVACLALTGSIASAKPRAKRTTEAREEAVASHAEDDEAADDDDEEADEEAAEDDDAGSIEEVDDPPPRRRRSRAPRLKTWHVALGPYLWASSVEASVSVGDGTVGNGVDFGDLSKNAKFGAEILAEARYGKLAITGDLIYGLVGIDSRSAVGPVMVTLGGEASSLLVDGAAGYLVGGTLESAIALEARAGVRYQRTHIRASVAVHGAPVVQPDIAMAGSDALAGARLFLRPSPRFAFTGTADIGVVGASSSTWSAALDGSARLTSWLLFSLGWRTLTIDRPSARTVMHGPRAAFQIVF